MVANVVDFTARSAITAEVIDLTPELATAFLECNTHNRPLPESKVVEYAGEMEAGRWQLNGDAIRFDVNGVLLDGQTRCEAVRLSGVTIKVVVIRGLAPESQITMDVGNRRSPSEQLNVADIKATPLTAAAVRVLILWEGGRLFGQNQVSTTELVRWAQDNRERVDRINTLASAWGLGRIKSRPSLAAAVALRFAEIDSDDAEEFFTGVVTGANLGPTSPMHVLRERLGRIRDQGLNLPARDHIGLFVVAWNAFRQGREIHKLQRGRSGFTPENFPEPV